MKLEKSHMEKHATSCHTDAEKLEFSMKVVKPHQSALTRQVHEAVRIKRRAAASNTTILNSKSEYSRCQLPRLILETNQKEEDTTECQEDEKTNIYELEALKSSKRKQNCEDRGGD